MLSKTHQPRKTSQIITSPNFANQTLKENTNKKNNLAFHRFFVVARFGGRNNIWALLFPPVFWQPTKLDIPGNSSSKPWPEACSASARDDVIIVFSGELTEVSRETSLVSCGRIPGFVVDLFMWVGYTCVIRCNKYICGNLLDTNIHLFLWKDLKDQRSWQLDLEFCPRKWWIGINIVKLNSYVINISLSFLGCQLLRKGTFTIGCARTTWPFLVVYGGWGVQLLRGFLTSMDSMIIREGWGKKKNRRAKTLGCIGWCNKV